MPNIKREEGFTLIELLVVIAIIGILAAVIFVALDPATRFADARDAVRQNDVQEILSAVKIYQVDNGGDFPVTEDNQATPAAINAGDVYMIGTAQSGCDTDINTTAGSCATVTSGTHCVALSSTLQTAGYLGEVPVAPDGEYEWNATLTGYTYSQSTNGNVTIESCESENATGAINAIR